VSSIDDELEAMRVRHRAIARYRIYYMEPRKKRGQQKTEIERDLTYDEACEKRDSLNAELKAKGMDRFMDPSYELEMTNAWDTFSDAAKERHLACGKLESDFRR
jgi:hypothetical protein